MKVALYYPWLYLRSGGERTISELIARSRHDWTLITNRFEPESTFPSLSQAKVIELPRVSVQRSFSHVARAAWRIGRQKLPLQGQQALVVFCEGLGDFVTFRNSHLPVICLCLTPLRASFDPHYQEVYLKMKGAGLLRRLLLNAFGAAFRVADRIAWRKYTKVFAISGEVRNRIVAGKLRAPKEIDVIYPGVDPAAHQPTGTYLPEFLIPGRIMWTKNLELGIDAFMNLMQRRPDLSRFRLIIAGFVDVKSRPYLAALRERASSCPQVEFIEAPSDEELFALYGRVSAIVYPPFNEDWGLVPIEAMMFGKPVVAVNRGGPTETIVNGRNGFLTEPDPQAFSVAMERFADDPELVREMGKHGREHVNRFDWRFFVEAMDNCIDRAVEGVSERSADEPKSADSGFAY